MRVLALAAALVGAVPATAFAAPPAGSLDEPPRVSPLSHRGAVARATLTVTRTGCAAFLAGAPDVLVTAAHCVLEGEDHVAVRTAGRARHSATIEHLDRDADLAVLRLAAPLDVEPLHLAEREPSPGDEVLFVGHAGRRTRPQLARVERVGQCPSLPAVDRAVFTTLDARPGDSGSPLVNDAGEVVGLVHGGTRCHIAAPVTPLLAVLGQAPAAPASPPVAAKPGGSRFEAGPFVVEETTNGFRLTWSFRKTFRFAFD